jgi:hypothetical protein
MCTGGAVVESWAVVDPWDVGSPALFSFSSLSISSIKLRILENFTLYLRNSWSLARKESFVLGCFDSE